MRSQIIKAVEKQLEKRLKDLGIRKADIQEKFIRSTGKGGQKINKTSSCVYLKHLPSGIEVKCHQQRSQALNRLLARRILIDKIQRIALKKLWKEKERTFRIKRQKRRRSKTAKEKMLKDKAKRSQKKHLRSYRPGKDDIYY